MSFIAGVLLRALGGAGAIRPRRVPMPAWDGGEFDVEAGANESAAAATAWPPGPTQDRGDAGSHGLDDPASNDDSAAAVIDGAPRTSPRPPAAEPRATTRDGTGDARRQLDVAGRESAKPVERTAPAVDRVAPPQPRRLVAATRATDAATGLRRHPTPPERPAGSRAAPPEGAPPVEIHIGRVEIVAAAPARARPIAEAKGGRRPLSLEDYLSARAKSR